MFSQRLTQLMDSLDINGSQLAQAAGFDRTNISRLKSGGRIIRPQSKTAKRLVDGIYRLAKDNGRTDLLCELVDAQEKEGEVALKDKILIYLFAGEWMLASKNGLSAKKQADRENRYFAERLNALMAFFDFSNIRFSKFLHVDASLISRYRTGVRSPLGNPELCDRIGDLFWDRIVQMDRLIELAGLIGISSEEINRESFKDWLFRRASLKKEHPSVVESLIGVINSLPEREPWSSFDKVGVDRERMSHIHEELGAYKVSGKNRKKAERKSIEKPSIYYGTKGFQEAVIRFLIETKEDPQTELFFYSDQSLDWFSENESFFYRWTSQTAGLIKQGTSVRIIHNPYRDLKNLARMIKGWLPLYMTGQIHSYYFEKIKESLFSHTIFLSPGQRCIAAFHVKDMEDEGIYRYITDPMQIAEYEKEFSKLLARANRLVDMQKGKLGDVFEPEMTVIENVYLSEHLVDGVDRHPKDDPGGEGEILVTCYDGGEPTYHHCGTGQMIFRNVKIYILEESVLVHYNLEPYFTFKITHPKLRRAFEIYVDDLINIEQPTLPRPKDGPYKQA